MVAAHAILCRVTPTIFAARWDRADLGQIVPYYYAKHRKAEYCWNTVALEDPSQPHPWMAWTFVEADDDHFVIRNLRWYAKRSSAKRASLRAYEAHLRRNEQQRLRNRCNKCEKRSKMKGDYLCRECRG